MMRSLVRWNPLNLAKITTVETTLSAHYVSLMYMPTLCSAHLHVFITPMVFGIPFVN